MNVSSRIQKNNVSNVADANHLFTIRRQVSCLNFHGVLTSMHITIHEGNARALISAEPNPPQFNPRNKHNENIWFGQDNKKGNNCVQNQNSEKLGNILTESLQQS